MPKALAIQINWQLTGSTGIMQVVVLQNSDTICGRRACSLIAWCIQPAWWTVMVDSTEGIRQDGILVCYHFKYCHLVILKSTHFCCCIVLHETCSMEWGPSWSWFLHESTYFAWTYAPKTIFTFVHHLPCDLKLVCLKWVTPLKVSTLYSVPFSS